MSKDDFLVELLQEMRDDIKEIRNDQKEVKEDINAIKISDAIQNEQLQEHMKRSETNEAALVELRRYIDEAIENIKSLLPKSFDYKKFINWFIGILLSLSALGGGILLIIQRYKGL